MITVKRSPKSTPTGVRPRAPRKAIGLTCCSRSSKFMKRSAGRSIYFDPIDVINYAIEELGHTQAELAELLGSRSRASEILSRRRALTVEMIHKISETWKIPADLLVRPYKIERAA